jgi:hypothetical protein
VELCQAKSNTAVWLCTGNINAALTIVRIVSFVASSAWLCEFGKTAGQMYYAAGWTRRARWIRVRVAGGDSAFRLGQVRSTPA